MDRILVIEDNYDTAKVLKKRLTDQGYDVLVAYDSYRGVAMAIKEEPDLVILDLMLPAGGGETVLATIRMNDNIRDTPVLILSAVTDEECKNTVRKMDIQGYMEKPYNPEELFRTVERILRTSTSGGE